MLLQLTFPAPDEDTVSDLRKQSPGSKYPINLTRNVLMTRGRTTTAVRVISEKKILFLEIYTILEIQRVPSSLRRSDHSERKKVS